MYNYDKEKIKNSLDMSQIVDLLTEFEAEPIVRNDTIICRTICHNNRGEGSHKLYYYCNSKLFHCYTGCDDPSFDIYGLVQKIISREENRECSLPEAIEYVARRFGFSSEKFFIEEQNDIKNDLKLFKKYDKINNIEINKQNIELKTYEANFLKNFPKVKIQPWINEGISQEVMNAAGIAYDPKNHGIVIPHYDIEGNLVGIRERTLLKEQAEQYGKYMPATIAGKQYTHPLSFNLYNLNHSKENIKRIKKVFVFESEKACLLYRTYFGEENDIAVATCGSNLQQWQFSLLMDLGVEEVIIAYDRQYKEIGDDEYRKWVAKLKAISKKYSPFCKISFMFDTEHLLGYKDAPIDVGKEVFLTLYKNRLNNEGKVS